MIISDLTSIIKISFFVSIFSLGTTNTSAESLPDIIDKIRPSIVGVGTNLKTRRPPSKLLGTGFVFDNGLKVATNQHVIDILLDNEKFEELGIFVGKGRDAIFRPAKILAQDKKHDVAILTIDGPPLPALKLGNDALVREGSSIAFTGFPIGAILGLHPVTHTGIVSAITPIVIPAQSSRTLTAKQIRYLREPFDIFQLDATAYPGNSGSPLFNTTNGEVIGVINLVFVKDKKESVLKNPSAISYAVPIKYLKQLLK